MDDREGVFKKHKRFFWWRILLLGFAAYLLFILIMIFTNNSNIFPTVVFLGSFLVPVTYVAFFYERKTICNVNMPTTALTFLYGGLLGTLAASILEPVFIHSLNFMTYFMVGVIEESAKILGVLVIAMHKKHNSELDGIILGAAAGMGFAAFESAGYAFTGFLHSGGSLTYTVIITLLRGVTSPVGHGTWTAIIASVLFRESALGKFNFNLKVLMAFLSVVILHGLWDGFPDVISKIIPFAYSTLSTLSFIGLAGLIILFRQWREASRHAYWDCYIAESLQEYETINLITNDSEQ